MPAYRKNHKVLYIVLSLILILIILTTNMLSSTICRIQANVSTTSATYLGMIKVAVQTNLLVSSLLLRRPAPKIIDFAHEYEKALVRYLHDCFSGMGKVSL